MALAFLSAIRPPVVASLPSGAMGDTVVLLGDGHLYTHNGTTWVDNGQAGAGGGTVGGKTTVDFDPGLLMASTVITGIAAIVSTSVVRAWLIAEATAEHNVDEHRVEQIDVVAGSIVDGVGFTIYARCNHRSYGEWSVGWEVRL